MTLSVGNYPCNIASCKDASVRYSSHNVVKAGSCVRQGEKNEKKLMLWTGSDASVFDAVREFEAQRFLADVQLLTNVCSGFQMSWQISKSGLHRDARAVVLVL